MFKNYLYTEQGRLFRGVYKTFDNAKRYGQKDFQNIDNAFFFVGHKDKKHEMFILNEQGEKLYKFEYKYM